MGTYRLVYHLNLPRVAFSPSGSIGMQPTPRPCRLPSTQGDYKVLIARVDRVTRAIRSDLPDYVPLSTRRSCSSSSSTSYPTGSNGIVILTLHPKMDFSAPYARKSQMRVGCRAQLRTSGLHNIGGRINYPVIQHRS